MANPLEPFSAIQVDSEYHFVRSSIGSVDQGLNWYLELIGNLPTHSLSDVLTMSMIALKENCANGSRVNSDWSSRKMGGKLRSLCLISPTCSCGVACLWKETNWISKYTKNAPKDYSLVSVVQRRDPYVKLKSSSMTCRNTCVVEQEPIVREYLPRSLLIYSEDFSKFWGEIW